MDHSVAGGETVSTFLAGTTCFLLQHPQALERLTREIRQAFSTYAEIHVQAAQQLPFLQAVINEGLRLYPPGSQGFPRVSPGFTLHGRYVPEGVSLDPLGRPSMLGAMKLNVDRQTEIYTSAWTVTHDPANFQDPMSFRPERWLDPDNTDKKEASQPFSLGPRGCLGRKYMAPSSLVHFSTVCPSYVTSH